MDTFNELISQLSKEIQDKEGRTRSRTVDEQIRFNYALTKMLEDIWTNYVAHPDSECSIHKRRGAYSENAKYRDPDLAYLRAVELDLVLRLKHNLLTE